MVRFGKKESAERRELLASMNSMHYNSAKQIDNGEFWRRSAELYNVS